MNFKNLKKTSIDNVYVLVEDVFNPIHGRTQEYTLYDFSQLQPMKVEESTTKSGAKIDIIKKNQIRHGRELYSAIMRYHKERDRTMALNACQVDDLNV